MASLIQSLAQSWCLIVLQVEGQDCGPAPAAWISAFLGAELRLVQHSAGDQPARPARPKYQKVTHSRSRGFVCPSLVFSKLILLFCFRFIRPQWARIVCPPSLTSHLTWFTIKILFLIDLICSVSSRPFPLWLP